MVLGVADALRHLADLLLDVLQPLAGGQPAPHRPVSRQVGVAGEHQVAQPGQAGEGERVGALLHRQPRDLGQAAGDERGQRVGAEAAAVADPGGDGHHVLDAAADLHAHHVAGGVGPEGLAVEGVLHLPRDPLPARRHRHRGGQPLGHLLGEGRAGEDGDVGVQRHREDVLQHLAHGHERVGLDPLGDADDGRAGVDVALHLDAHRPDDVRRHRQHHQLGPLQRLVDVGRGEDVGRDGDARAGSARCGGGR